jgi:hypothetical protein
MLIGQHPFGGVDSTTREIYDEVLKRELNYNSKTWKQISSEARDLVQ